MYRLFALLLSVFTAVAPGISLGAGQAPDAAEVRAALVPLLPEGVRIDSVRIDGARGTVLGSSPSNALVSNFLRSIDGSVNFERVELLQIRAESNRMAFELSMDITCSTAPDSPCLVPEAGAGNTPTAPKRASVYKCRVNGALRFQDQPCAAGTESP